jgi:hypothetical protein
MNAPEIEAKIADPTGRAAQLAARGASRDEIVNELCLAAFGRPPTESESKAAEDLLGEQPGRESIEDLLWTLLNSYDFLFIH